MTYSCQAKLRAVACVAAQAGISIGPRELRAMAASHGWPVPTFEQCLEVIDSLFALLGARPHAD
jgi:hypothetical protein